MLRNGLVDLDVSLEIATTDEDDDYPEIYDDTPDVLWLNVSCARARNDDWTDVREWLRTHTAEQVKMAAEQRGENGLTALHFACRHVPPADVIDVLLSIAGDTVKWTDNYGWLPIHYACASGSDPEVIQALAEQYRESLTVTDSRGRTPLHFALGEKPASPAVVFLLSSSGAAKYPDDIGMLVRALVIENSIPAGAH